MRKVVAIDVETTGIGSSDRIVSFGAVRVDLPAKEEHCPETVDIEMVHLIFNPGRPSHSRARAVHGWADRALRLQPPFEAHATVIASMIETADMVVAHNLSFDRSFVDREFERLGHRLKWPATICTMLSRREIGLAASLSAAISNLGLSRRSEIHGALEDAALALLLYESDDLGFMPHRAVLNALFAPTNYVPPPAVSTAGVTRAYRSKSPSWRFLGPPLSLLAALAHADGSVGPEERQVLAAALEHFSASIETAPTTSTIRSILDMLAATAPTEADLASAREWLGSGQNRIAFTDFAAAIIRADGQLDTKEVEVMRRIAALARPVSETENSTGLIG